MYNHGKSSKGVGRQAVTPKDSQIFGPQWSLQASSVNEKTTTTRTYRDSPGSAQSDSNSASHLSKRYAHPNDNIHVAAIQDKVNSTNRRQFVSTATGQDLSGTVIDGYAGDSIQNRQALSAPQGAHKQSVFLPGDRVIFSDSISSPGVPVVYRTQEERNANPDRLNLDRRNLTLCPKLEGEDQLRLLNYQHNLITRIDHLNGLRKLIFLDLYDNHIEEISGLSSLRSLRVLMLGKNKIKRIENLDCLVRLDVLDLHGNRIASVENLNHLKELRVLNLAGNDIKMVDNLSGLDALAELNLRRNRIRALIDVDNLPNLQRLFLSFNEIQSFSDIQCLQDSLTLSEVSLDGNPISNDHTYKQTIIRHMQRLKQLDMKRITDEERRIAIIMSQKEEMKKRETRQVAVIKEKRKIALDNVIQGWNSKYGQKMPDVIPVVRYVDNVPNERTDDAYSSDGSRPTSARPTSAQNSESVSSATRRPNSRTSRDGRPSKEDKEPVVISSLAVSGSKNSLSHLAEIEGDTLNLYGSGSLEALDRSWGIQAAGAVTTIAFQYIDFLEIIKHLHKIRARFPSVQNLSFKATNISSLQQLNALANLRRLDSLEISNEGNPITKFSLWQWYALFRLAHFSLRKINNTEIKSSDIVNAEKLFGPLGHIVSSQLTPTRLAVLVAEHRKRLGLLPVDDKNRKSPDNKTDAVQRAGLSFLSPDQTRMKAQERTSRIEFANGYVNEICQEAILVDKKRMQLQEIWPQIFLECVHGAILDMKDLETYKRKCYEEIES